MVYLLWGPICTTIRVSAFLKFVPEAPLVLASHSKLESIIPIENLPELFRAPFSFCFMCPNTKPQIQIINKAQIKVLCKSVSPASILLDSPVFLMKWFLGSAHLGRCSHLEEQKCSPVAPSMYFCYSPGSDRADLAASNEDLQQPTSCLIPSVFSPFSTGTLSSDLSNSFWLFI